MASALDGFFGAQRSALDSQDRFQETRARNMAGKRMAVQDYSGAASELYSGGQIEAGADVQNFGNAQESNARKVNAEQVKERASLLMQVSRGLKEVPAGQRKAQLDRISPIFQKVGLDATMFGQLSEQDLSDEALDAFAGSVAQEVEFIKSSDGSYTAASKSTGLPQFQYQAPRPDEFKEVDPAKDLVRIPGSSGGASAPGMGGASGGFEAAIGPLLEREGGFVAKDGRSGAPANFGINQKFNPDVDVKNLTADQAKQLYKTRYWDAINADQLPPDAQAAVFDAAVNQGPETAVKMWQESGQNVQRFNQLRLDRYRQTPGYAESGKSWERRVAETGGSQGAPAGGPEVVRAAQPKPRDPAKTFTQEQQLRAQFGGLPQVKDFANTKSYVDTIGAIASRAKTGKPVTAADDLALIFSYMKLLDPGSVVREGEFANAQNTAGIPDRIVNAYNRALKGTRLSDKQRAEFFTSATTVMQSFTNNYSTQAERYRGLAEGYGLNPDSVAPAPKRPTPKVSAPTNAVQYLKANPNLSAAFDAKYGKGAAAAVLGK